MKDQENKALASHGDLDGDARLSLAMDKYLEGGKEPTKLSPKYSKAVRKRRKACCVLQKV